MKRMILSFEMKEDVISDAMVPKRFSGYTRGLSLTTLLKTQDAFKWFHLHVSHQLLCRLVTGHKNHLKWLSSSY